MTRYSLDLRRRAVNAYKEQGGSIRKVAAVFQISPNTLLAWLKRERETGNLHPQPATGGTPSQLKGHEEQLKEMVQTHRDYTLAEYCEYWREHLNQDVHLSTMSRWLIQHRYSYKKNNTSSESHPGRGSAPTSRVLGAGEPHRS